MAVTGNQYSSMRILFCVLLLTVVTKTTIGFHPRRLSIASRNGNPWGLALSIRGGSDYDNDEEPCVFISEVVIVAEDRKLLLADCSEVVSEMSEILRTGSSTSREHATLVFLVQIDGLHQMQRLMDSLQQIRSVMSVERRVSPWIVVSRYVLFRIHCVLTPSLYLFQFGSELLQ